MTPKNISWQQFLFGCGIVVFWIGIILFFLYSPQLTRGSQRRTLNILAWPQIIDGEFLVDFEKEHGVTIKITYFESNEELLAKLRSSRDHDYDIIMPSDFFLSTFIQEGFIKPLDKSRLTFWNDIHPQLKNLPFDPQNKYTVPCFWTVYGIGVDLDYFQGKLPELSWKLIFEPDINGPKICLIEDVPQLVALTALYLYGMPQVLPPYALSHIQKVLIEQKKRVVAYTDMRVEYLLASGAAPVVVATSSDMAKMVDYYENIAFFIPKEGSLVIIDSFVIAADTKKDDLIYDFLNYLYKPEIMKQYAQKFTFPSPLSSVTIDYPLSQAIFTADNMPPLYFIQRWFSTAQYEKIWVALRTA